MYRTVYIVTSHSSQVKVLRSHFHPQYPVDGSVSYKNFYACDFFWRQSLPVAKLAVPKALEILFGQNVRGGGEYLGFKSSWANAGKSIEYFREYYAKNSY